MQCFFLRLIFGRFHDFGHFAACVRLPAGVRGSNGAGAGAGRHGAGRHGQHAGLPPPPLQVQGAADRLGRTHLLGPRQRHVLLGTLRLQRGLQNPWSYFFLFLAPAIWCRSYFSNQLVLSVAEQID